MSFFAQQVDANGRTINSSGYDPVNHVAAIPQAAASTTDATTQAVYAPAITQPAATNAAVAAGAATAAQVLKATPGYLSGVLVTALGTAAMSIYDNATVASGLVIGYVPASTAAGTFVPCNMPALNGITVGKVLNSPACTVALS